jgi:hypothetical protein
MGPISPETTSIWLPSPGPKARPSRWEGYSPLRQTRVGTRSYHRFARPPPPGVPVAIAAREDDPPRAPALLPLIRPAHPLYRAKPFMSHSMSPKRDSLGSKRVVKSIRCH